MPSPLDDLVNLPGLAGDSAREQLQNPAMPLETPDQTRDRIADTQRQQQQIQRMRASDLAARDIPHYTTPEGTVEAVRDSDGVALTNFDKRHNLAWDSKGNAVGLQWGESGAPSVVDAMSQARPVTDKAGNTYQVRDGLPWAWTGFDPAVKAKYDTAQEQKELGKAATALGRKLTLDEHDIRVGDKQKAALRKALTTTIPALNDPEHQGAGRDQILSAIDAYYNGEAGYGAPDANATTGWFGNGTLSPEAMQRRLAIDQEKAQAHSIANQLFDLEDNLSALRTRAGATRSMAHQVTGRLTDSELSQLGISLPDASQVPQNQQNGVANATFGTGGEAVLSDELALQAQQDPELRRGIFSELGAMVARNWGGAMAGIGKMLRFAGIEGAGRDIQAYWEEVQQGNEESTHLRGFQPQEPMWWANTIGGFAVQAVPQLAIALGTAGAGTVAQLGGMALMGAGMMAGEQYDRAVKYRIEHGEDPDQARDASLGEAALVGVVGGALDLIPGAEYFTKNPMIRSMLGRYISKAGVQRFLAGGAAEAFTEVAQDVISDLGAQGMHGDAEAFRDWAERYATTAIGAFFTGGAIDLALGHQPAAQPATPPATPAAPAGLGAPSTPPPGPAPAPAGGTTQGPTPQPAGGPAPGSNGTNGANATASTPPPSGSTPPPQSSTTGGSTTTPPPTNGSAGTPPPNATGSNAKGGPAPSQPPKNPFGTQAEFNAYMDAAAARGDSEGGHEAWKINNKKWFSQWFSNANKTKDERARSFANSVISKRSNQEHSDFVNSQQQQSGDPGSAGTAAGSGTATGRNGGTPGNGAESGTAPAGSTAAAGAAAGSPGAGNGSSAPVGSGVSPAPEGNAGGNGGRSGVSGSVPGNVATGAPSGVDAKAHEAASSPTNDRKEPTAAQAKAGNYKKGHVTISGLPISIENPAGSIRQDKHNDPPKWRTEMKRAHYGYIKRTEGKDSTPENRQGVDIFVKEGTPTDWDGTVYVVNQVDPSTGKFDESKVVLGASSEMDAQSIYLSNYAPGWKGMGSISKFKNVAAFKAWLPNAKKARPRFPKQDSGTSPVNDGPTTPERALATVRAVTEELAQDLERLGVKGVDFTSTTNPSGAQMIGGRIRIDPAKLARSMEAVRARQQRDNIQSTPEEWVKAVIWHEALHSAQKAIASEQGTTMQAMYDAVPDSEFPKALMDFAAEAYGPEWDGLQGWQKKAEAVRMVAEGRWRGTITEALYKILHNIHAFIKRMAGELEGAGDWLKSHVADLEQRINGIKVSPADKGKDGAGSGTATPAKPAPSTQAGKAQETSFADEVNRAASGTDETTQRLGPRKAFIADVWRVWQQQTGKKMSLPEFKQAIIREARQMNVSLSRLDFHQGPGDRVYAKGKESETPDGGETFSFVTLREEPTAQPPKPTSETPRAPQPPKPKAAPKPEPTKPATSAKPPRPPKRSTSTEPKPASATPDLDADIRAAFDQLDAADPESLNAADPNDEISVVAAQNNVRYDGRIEVPGIARHQFTIEDPGTPAHKATFILKGEFSEEALRKRVTEKQAEFGAGGSLNAADPAAADTPEFRRWFGESKVVDERGRPLVVAHGTRADFSVVDPTKNQLGFHIGPPEQANHILGTYSVDGQRIMPLFARIRNPIRLEDMGNWSYESVVPQLERAGIIVPERVKSEHRSHFEEGDTIVPKDWARFEEWSNTTLRSLIESAGYDGVVYLNRTEGVNHEALDKELGSRVRSRNDYSEHQLKKHGAKDSWIAFRPEQIKSAIGNRGTFDPKDANMLNAADPAAAEHRGIPREHKATFNTLAEKMLDAGIDTPEAMYGKLADVIGQEKARRYSKSMWRFLGAVEPDLPDVSNDQWGQIFQGRKLANLEISPVTDARPPALDADRKQALPEPDWKMMMSRDKFPGEDYAAPASSIVVQLRDLESNPLSPDMIYAFPYDGTEEGARKVFEQSARQLLNYHRASKRESVKIATNADGVAQWLITQNPGTGETVLEPMEEVRKTRNANRARTEARRQKPAEAKEPQAEPAPEAPKPPKLTSSPAREAFEADPAVAHLIGAGGLLSRSAAIRKHGKEWWERNKGEWDDVQPMANPSHNVIYRPNGLQPDDAVKSLQEAGLLGETATPPDLWALLHRASRTAESVRRQGAAQARQQNEAKAQHDAFERDRQKQDAGEKPFTGWDLHKGDQIRMDGELLTVTEDGPEHVTLEDGKKYGRQTIEPDQVIYAKREPEKNKAPETAVTGTDPAALADRLREVEAQMRAMTDIPAARSGADRMRMLANMVEDTEESPRPDRIIEPLQQYARPDSSLPQEIRDAFNDAGRELYRRLSPEGAGEARRQLSRLQKADLAPASAEFLAQPTLPKLQPGTNDAPLIEGDARKTPEQLAAEAKAEEDRKQKMQDRQDVRVGAQKPLRAGEDIRPERDMFGADRVEGDDLFDQTRTPGNITDLNNAPATSTPLERDRGDGNPGDTGGPGDIQGGSGRTGPDTGGVVGTRGEVGNRQQGDRSPADNPAGDRGTESDSVLPERGPGTGRTPADAADGYTGGTDTAGGKRALAQSGADSSAAPADNDRVRPEPVAAGREESLEERRRKQKEAENLPYVVADPENIRATLPVLLPAQQDDVLKAERRLNVAGKKGILFTNATGCGKTFTALGIMKRALMGGARNILVVVPTQVKVKDWSIAARDLNMELVPVVNTKDAGKPLAATTYATFRSSDALASRDWDLIVLDESHKLVQNQEAETTAAMQTHRWMSNHPYSIAEKVTTRIYGPQPPRPGRDVTDQEKAASDRWWDNYQNVRRVLNSDTAGTGYQQAVPSALIDKVKAVRASLPDTKVVFLSATPFAYHKTLQYAEGYLYENPAEGSGSYNSAGGFDRYMVENFGYRMRYNKVTQPEASVDVDLLEREWNERMQKEGAISGRAIDVPFDYSREFVALDPGMGLTIDRGIKILNRWEDYELNKGWQALPQLAKARFAYVPLQQLLESIKVQQGLARIREHLAMGRKIILFHTYVNAAPRQPFNFEAEAQGDARLRREVDEFKDRYPEIASLNLGSLSNPLEMLKREFGDQVVFFNGTVSDKQKFADVDAFNDDNGVPRILVAQRQSMAEGVSAHDTTGRFQRVVIDVGLPVEPTKSIQQEGRAFRVGQASNAIFEYFTLNLDSERFAFGSKIAGRARTAENLAMGHQARNLEDAFRSGYLNSTAEPPHARQGIGGKETDRRANTVTPFERAKTYYFQRQNKTSRNKSAEGIDYYPTPEPLGMKMVEWAQPKPDEEGLEPSAGHGAIGRFFPRTTRNKFVEPSLALASELQVKIEAGSVLTHRFEDLHISNKFQFIVMNPPFGHAGKTAWDHLHKALVSHLADGGRVVALIPEGSSMANRLDKWTESDESKPFVKMAEFGLPTVTFERAGTSVKARIVIFDRYNDEATRRKADSRSRGRYDIAADTIEELFGTIEQLGVPDRVELPTAREANVMEQIAQANAGRTGGAAPQKQGDWIAAQFKHTKTGKPVFVANSTKRMSDSEYARVKSIAKRHDGYWSSFKGAGAIPGFHFPSEQNRKAFLDAVAPENLGAADPADGETHGLDALGDAMRAQAGRLENPGDYRLEFHLATVLSRTLLPWQRAIDAAKVDLSGLENLPPRTRKRIEAASKRIEKLRSDARAMLPEFRERLSNIVASLPERTVRDGITGRMVDPFASMKAALPGGKEMDVAKAVKEAADLASGIFARAYAREGMDGRRLPGAGVMRDFVNILENLQDSGAVEADEVSDVLQDLLRREGREQSTQEALNDFADELEGETMLGETEKTEGSEFDTFRRSHPADDETLNAADPFADEEELNAASPIYRRSIDSVWQRIWRGGRWFWEGTADVMRRRGFHELADAIWRQQDESAKAFASAWKPIREAMDSMDFKSLRQAKKEFEMYFRHRENGRHAAANGIYAAASPGGQKLIRAWKETALQTGRILQAMDVHVRDGNRWRKIGHLGENFFPRKINQDAMRVLRDPEKYAAEWAKLVNDLIANGNIRTASEADRFLKDHVFRKETDSDHFGNIERARSTKLPESWLEYQFDEIAPWYVGHYSRRLGQIAAYGQQWRPGGDLWDQVVETIPGSPDYDYTRRYIAAAKEAAYFTRSNTDAAINMKNLQAIATGTFLSNPFSTIRNAVSGLSQNLVTFGAVDTMKGAFEALTSSAARLTPHDIGVLRQDLFSILMEGRDDTSIGQRVRKVANAGLHYTGFNLAEEFVRTTAVLSAYRAAQRAAAAIRRNPNSKESLEWRAFLQRFEVDPMKIATENGRGQESERFARRAVNDSQGGYTFAQTPLIQSDPYIGFMTQFQKWGTQMTRFLVKHTINPAIFGTEVRTATGTVTVRSFRPFLYAMAFAAGGGELLYWLKELLQGRPRTDASLEEVGNVWKQGQPMEAVGLAMGRVVSDVIMAGTLGVLSDYGANFKEFATRGRFKNPFDPPGIQFIKNLADGTRIAVQQGKLTFRDMADLIEKQLPGLGFTEKFIKRIAGDRLQQAQNTRSLARAAGRRMAEEEGLPVRASFGSDTPVRTENSPFNDQLESALLSGNQTEARRLVAQRLAGAKTAEQRRKLATAMKAVVTANQPITVGGIPSAENRQNFLRWMRKRLPADQAREIERLDAIYWRTATAAGLTEGVPQPRSSGGGNAANPLTWNGF